MKVFLLVLLILFLISLIPIPVIVKAIYNKEDYYVKIYKFYVLHKPTNSVDSNENINILKNEKIKKHKNKKRFINIKFLLKDFIFPDYLELVRIISDNKFKPHIYINGYIDYSLYDSAYTAISFGVISTYLPLLYWFLKLIFKPKKFNLPVRPIFKDEFLINTEIKSIITISIAQTIYMAFLIIKGILFIKACKIEGGYNNEC